MRDIIKIKLIGAAARFLPADAARRLLRDRDGAVAVEFGLVAVPFLAILFAIMETAIVFFSGQVLETAVANSARLILTGQAQTGNYTQAQFKTAVCGKIYGLFDCTNGIYVDVRNYSAFSAVDLSMPVDNNKNFTPNSMQFAPGGPGCITVVRLFYQYPIYLSLAGFSLSNLSGGKRLLAATAAFRNEPYATGAGSC